jgi:hypothetical protein
MSGGWGALNDMMRNDYIIPNGITFLLSENINGSDASSPVTSDGSHNFPYNNDPWKWAELTR